MPYLLIEERNKQIGENIRKYRLLKGLTNDDLCSGICSSAQLSKIENGKTYAQRDILKQLADRLGIPLHQIEASDAMQNELSDHLQLSKNSFSLGHNEESLIITERVISQSKIFNYQDIYFESCIHKANILVQSEHFQDAVNFLENVLDEIPTENRYTPHVMYFLGYAHQHNGNVVKAHDYFTRSYELYESQNERDDDLIHLQIVYALAQCHGILKYNRIALHYAEKSEKLALKLSKHLYRLRSKYMKGTILKRLEQYDKALIELKESLQEAEANNYLLDAAIISINLGELYRDTKEYNLARSCYSRAKNLLEILDNHTLHISTILQFAELDILLKDYANSVKHIDKALSMIDNLNSDIYLEQARAYRLSAEINYQKGIFDSCKADMLKALQIYEEKNYFVDAYDLAAEIARRMDEYQDPLTLEMYRKALAYNEIILSSGMRR